jgi:transposase
MSRAYSIGLRERVVEAVEGGASRREAADRFEIRPSSAIKGLERWRASGSVAAKPTEGSISPLEEHASWLLALIAEHPDLTLEEAVAAMGKRRIAGSRSAVWRFFRATRSVLEKACAQRSKRAPTWLGRAGAGIRRQGLLDTTAPVFLDETASATNIVRLRGRCPRGQRLIGRVPHGHWKTITLVAGLRHDGMVAPCASDAPMNRAKAGSL